MGEFLSVYKAQKKGLIPDKNNIVGFPGLGVYVSEYGGTAACSLVDDGNIGVLNIYSITEGMKVTCGHILDDGTCGYRFGKNGEVIKCPILELNSVIIENPKTLDKAA